MEFGTRRSFVVALLASAVWAVGVATDVARASGKKKSRKDHDHDDAWSAREGGSILPLSEVLTAVGLQIDGEIIETEFEYEDGRPVYEFKYVDRNGRLAKLYVDARTGIILKNKPD